MRGGGFHLILVGTIRAIQHGLGEFQEPVAEIIPGEAITSLRIIIEAEAFQGCIGFGQRRIAHIQNPARKWQPRRGGIKPCHLHNAIHFAKPRRVPDFGGEGAIAFHPLPAELDVASR